MPRLIFRVEAIRHLLPVLLCALPIVTLNAQVANAASSLRSGASLDETVHYLEERLSATGTLAARAEWTEPATNSATHTILYLEERLSHPGDLCQLNEHITSGHNGVHSTREIPVPLALISDLAILKSRDSLFAGKEIPQNLQITPEWSEVSFHIAGVQNSFGFFFPDAAGAEAYRTALQHAHDLCNARGILSGSEWLRPTTGFTLLQQAPSHRTLDHLSNQPNLFGAVFVSHNAKAVAWNSFNGTGWSAWFWSEEDGRRNITELGLSNDVQITSLSDDGTTLLVNRTALNHKKPLVQLWHRGQSVLEMNELEQHEITGGQLNADGSVIFGTRSNNDWAHPKHLVSALYRWSSEGLKEVYKAPEGSYITLSGVGTQGDFCYGQVRNAASTGNTAQAFGFIWTRSSGVLNLGSFLPTHSPYPDHELLGRADGHPARWSVLSGVQLISASTQPGDVDAVFQDSANAAGFGSRVVKRDDYGAPIETHLVHWSKENGAEEIGTLDGSSATFYAASADGEFLATEVIKGEGRELILASSGLLLSAVQLRRDEALATLQAASQHDSALQQQIDSVLATGHPARIYSLAGDLAADNHPELALKVLDALIQRYPDSPFTMKAIDLKDSLRHQNNKGNSSAAQQPQG